MKGIILEFSLLPYLESNKSNDYLELSLVTQDISLLEKSFSPFIIVDNSDPIARLVEAEFITNSGNNKRKVFLLIQKDQYNFSQDEINLIDNCKIDSSWHKAYSYYINGNHESSLIFIPGLTKNEDKPIRLSSLFFCKIKQTYFHPPCPKCGSLLEQCEDDNFLTSLGLQNYSNTTKRYLYCQTCSSQSEDRNLYVNELDQFDPPFLRNRIDLIKDFAFLVSSGNTIDKLPCTNCNNQDECYSASFLTQSRIVPFSFYPFYMFVFDSFSLNSIDFLSIISGETFENVEARLESRREIGRFNCLQTIEQNCVGKIQFIYNQNKKHFLEILYLKLYFLEKLFDNLVFGNSIIVPRDIKSSISRTWVKIDRRDENTPFFWNFKVEFLDISRHLIEKQPNAKAPSLDDFFFLGMHWFNTLLSNKGQGTPEIYSALKELRDQFFSMPDVSFDELYNESYTQVFQPENIFYYSEDNVISEKENILWGKTINLGWSLITRAFDNSSEWYKQFYQQLISLRNESKNDLFNKCKNDSLDVSWALHAEDNAIYDILIRIFNKWQKESDGNKEDFDQTLTCIRKENEADTILREDLDQTIVAVPNKKKMVLKIII